MNKEDILFPHEEIREVQDELIETVQEGVTAGTDVIVHAPTGLGKTVASIGPALKYALENKKTVFFLTSRHTQHKIVIETLRAIKDTFKTKFTVVDLIGKKWMCLQPGVNTMFAGAFADYCNKLKAEGTCEYFSKLKKGEKITTDGNRSIKEIKSLNTPSNEQIIEVSREHGVCPYYTAMQIAKKANVIIGDYYYIFSPGIRENYLAQIGKELKDCIVIVDEGHNLPNRIKDLASERLTTIMTSRAVKEAEKHGYEELSEQLTELSNVLESMGDKLNSNSLRETEKYIRKEDFIDEIRGIAKYEKFVQDLKFIGDAILEEQKLSYIRSIADFLEAWLGEDEGFTRIISKHISRKDKKEYVMVSYRCLDASVVSEQAIKGAYCTIMMSGTLTPTLMYKEILGFPEDTIMETFRSPFPEKNKLNIIVPKTSTKYEKRSTEQYKEIAKAVATMTNTVPGNSVVFFPSYRFRDDVYQYYNHESEKAIFLESAEMNKKEKEELLEKFKEYNKKGAVLLGVAKGNFAEGIDLPGDYLKCVIVVGLPLQRPDLETKALIDYFDNKFGKGWDYGYLFPAFNNVLQSAGRCIRSETDKGVIVFLDERFHWNNYRKCFPETWDIKTTMLYRTLIKRFFEENGD